MKHLVAITSRTSRYVSSAPTDSVEVVTDPSPPIGRAFVGFAVAMVVASIATFFERNNGPLLSDAVAAQFGMVGTTVFLVAGLAALYRAVTTRTRTIAPVVALLLGPGALWCWLVFVRGTAIGWFAATLVVLTSAVVGILLLLEGLSHARWLGVFCGLGAVGICVAATVVRSTPETKNTVSLALLVAFAGMACLYGTLVEIESSTHKSFEQLFDAKRRIEAEIVTTEELLHDLRTGLLSIETAMTSVDDEISGPIRSETARLRQLASKRTRKISEFDLVPHIRQMAKVRRVSGLVVDLRLPSAAQVIGEESEIMAIVDNMLSNAHRHGVSPVRLEVAELQGEVRLAVADSGRVPINADTNDFFERGFSTHDDGEGIGLDRARILAELNGGSVDYVPGPNGETSFVLAIPSASTLQDVDEGPPVVSWTPVSL